MPRVRRRLPIVIIAILATGLAAGSQLAGVAPLDALAYARWRHPAPPSGGILLVAGAEAAGDQASLDRLIARLSRAGAATIVAELSPRL